MVNKTEHTHERTEGVNTPSGVRVSKIPLFLRILLLYSPFILIDFVQIMGKANYIELLGKFACFIDPYLIFSKIFIPSQLIDYASTQCIESSIKEPALSIIFFMLKINLAVFIAVIFILISDVGNFVRFLLTGKWESKKLVDIQKMVKKKTPRAFDRAKQSLLLLIGLGLSCLFFYYKYNILPKDFKINSRGKVDEGMMALVVGVTSLIYILLINYIFIILKKTFNLINSLIARD